MGNMYVVQMGSGAMIYIPSFVRTGSAVPKLLGGAHIWIQIARWAHKPTSTFSKYGKWAKNKYKGNIV
jgi:hypothetical protein